jgi:hypothetical protein
LHWSRLNWLAGFLASHLELLDECFLWITEYGVWPSSENFHLFYRIRESYGEGRLLGDAPGHLFLKHEKADLTTFILLALLSGWDFHLLSAPTDATAFVSHDGFMELNTDDHEAANEASKLFSGATVESVMGHIPK